jgi:uncharacterized protein (TIGR04255 family)
VVPDRFKNPPLVELLVEIQWGSQPPVGIASMPMVPVDSGAHEEFFMNFGQRVSQEGYSRAERLMPPGFPVPPTQVVWRFRKPDSVQTPIFQVGTGVFTTNITPPYHSWEKFRPFVELGINLLLESRPPTLASASFSSINLRYLDVFGQRFLRDQSIATFITNILGFKIELPAALKREMTAGAELKPMLQVSYPVRDHQNMTIALAEGAVAGEVGLVMNTQVVTAKPTEAKTEIVMNWLEMAHEIIRRSFIEMSQKIHDIMIPEN